MVSAVHHRILKSSLRVAPEFCPAVDRRKDNPEAHFLDFRPADIQMMPDVSASLRYVPPDPVPFLERSGGVSSLAPSRMPPEAPAYRVRLLVSLVSSWISTCWLFFRFSKRVNNNNTLEAIAVIV